jgi:hypothetical protein
MAEAPSVSVMFEAISPEVQLSIVVIDSPLASNAKTTSCASLGDCALVDTLSAPFKLLELAAVDVALEHPETAIAMHIARAQAMIRFLISNPFVGVLSAYSTRSIPTSLSLRSGP